MLPLPPPPAGPRETSQTIERGGRGGKGPSLLEMFSFCGSATRIDTHCYRPRSFRLTVHSTIPAVHSVHDTPTSPPARQSRHNQKARRSHELQVWESMDGFFSQWAMTRYAPECLPLQPSRIGVPSCALATHNPKGTKEALLRTFA